MPSSILDAIKLGIWDFEPIEHSSQEFEPTRSLPGSDIKLEVLTERLELGLPLWHPSDRRSYDDSE
ncbi:MAG TPA: hypothetical protein DHW38_14950 [Planctomycetaceae bacterium]|nr:hypothetical protein [Rhodopirellula sp.]HCK72874.1 hypothetical protein [Planctomycetaceae bacterium]HCP85066.1 hypothetical protein [Planctomycetaceae bacterium]